MPGFTALIPEKEQPFFIVGEKSGLAEHLTRYTRLPAHQVLPIGLSARAATAQLEAVGGGLEDVRDRLLVSATDYYRYLATDLATAEKRVVIYSPFVTPDRVSEIDPHFRELTHRGVPVYIVTKPLRERAKQHRNASRQVEEHLQRLGIRILHKRAMHEKVVLIDDEICWVGSLNTLSFSKTAEVMERRHSRDITRDYIKHLRIEELITVFDDEELSCPVCSSDMEAAEGNAGPYWRCENECFSRSLDQPYPHDGKLKCSSCGADVEFGYWGSEPHWRCTANRRHRQRVVRQHLELPKMLGIVPRRELRQLRSRWNMD